MSIKRTRMYYVTCDKCGKDMENPDGDSKAAFLTRTEATEAIGDNGWVVRKRKLLCGICQDGGEANLPTEKDMKEMFSR